MKLEINYTTFCEVLQGESLLGAHSAVIDRISFDSRRFVDGSNTAFFALKGEFRDGHDFLEVAYDKGVRIFVVSDTVDVSSYPHAHFVRVKNTLEALQDLAAYHRSRFSYPIIAITGSAGKTTVKEWIYHLLSPELRIIRSPKSYNSQLGVALSLLELHADCDLALIEAGISKTGEMERLEKMIQPTYGVFTSFGRAHEENFTTVEAHFEEKIKLFGSCKHTFISESIRMEDSTKKSIHGDSLSANGFKNELALLPWTDSVSATNALTALAFAKAFSSAYPDVVERIPSLPRLAMRMELFDGINGNTIINDTYNLDLDALTHSLDYQLRIAGDRQRVVLVGLDDDNAFRKEEVTQAIQAYAPDYFVVLKKDETFHETFSNALILIKGTRQADMQRLAKQFRLKNHKTFVEIDLSIVRENVMQYKSLLRPDTKILAMVKAQSYGSGVEKMAAFLEQQGVNALGVAYADEGVELRKQGITLPILVMNAEEDGFDDCIQYCLEPAVFSFRQLDLFIRALIDQGCGDHPIHIKIDTGMKRLGFELNEVERLCQLLNAQPEVHVKSVYSHLADSDNRRDKRFTEHQIKHFHQATEQLARHLNYHFDRHILNSEGVANFPEAQFEMVRLGIGMYGITGNTTFAKKLQPAIRWYSAISQIKHIQKGESVGYSRSFIATEPLSIAVIPVGYADGFRRSLGNGKGGVYIHESFCPTVGRVCMDMIMVDVTKLHAKEGDKVEIIGKRQSIGKFAAAMDTIPYEVMTSISKRVHRVYLD